MKEIWPGWETVEAIGTGGFAQVYKIRKKDTGDEREYCSALKIISIPQSPYEYAAYQGEGYDDETITAIFTNQMKRIEDEFHLMAQFKGNSNVVSYEDHMIVPHEDGKGWDILIRMELLTSLTSYCSSTAMTDEETMNLGIGICHALELCQKKNIIHRDIKPQNIFVNEFGDYKLGDFGIAKAMDHTTHATKTGTYTYMAPEVYRGESYGSTVDIYSLGLVLYWLLNERRMPFLPLPPEAPTATQIEESRTRRLSGEVLPPPKNGSDELKAIVLKACAFHAADRYSSPTQMRQDLERTKALMLAAIPLGENNGAYTEDLDTVSTVYMDPDSTVYGAATGDTADHTVLLDNSDADNGIAEDGNNDSGASVDSNASGSSEDGSDDESPLPPVSDKGKETPGKGKLFAVIGGILLIVIIIILLLLRGCGSEGNAGSATTTTGLGSFKEPAVTTTADGDTDTEPPVTTTLPETEEPTPPAHEHSKTSDDWETDGLSHWYVCECGEAIEKAEHTYGEWEVVKDATETENGEKARSCLVCSFKETDTIPLKAHEHSYAETWFDNETSHWYECSCGEKTATAAHSFSEWNVTKPATETETGTRERSCVICGHQEQGIVPVLSHVHSYTGSFVKNETTHWHACECGEKADVAAHTFGAWTVTKAATCTTSGSQTHACVVCGYTESQTIQPTGHTEVADAAVAATCTQSGLTAGKHCSVCDTVLVKQNTVAATGVHIYAEGTCRDCGKGEESTVTVGDETITVTYGQTYGALPTPTKVGYTFKGWYLNGVQIVSGSTVTTVGNHTLEDEWLANTYTVVYDGNKPSNASSNVSGVPSNQTWTYDANSTLGKAPSLTGWAFGGWYTDAMCTQKAGDAGASLSKPNYATSGTVTLYAKWIANAYTVNYNGNGATSGNTAASNHTYDTNKALSSNGFVRQYTVTFNYNGSGAANTTLTATYSFVGWANAANGAILWSNAQSVTNLSSEMNGNVTLYAKWNTGTVTLPAPTRTGYSFDGWYADASCNNKIGNAGASYTPSANTTLYAKWNANTYTVSYNANGASSGSMDASTHTYDASKVLTENKFSRSGYVFLGWSTNKSAKSATYYDKASVKNLASSGNVNLYAVWLKVEASADYSTSNSTRDITLKRDAKHSDLVSTGLDCNTLLANGYVSLEITISFDAKRSTLISFNGCMLEIYSDESLNTQYWDFSDDFSTSWGSYSTTATISISAISSDGSFFLNWYTRDWGGSSSDGWVLGTTTVTIKAVK